MSGVSVVSYRNSTSNHNCPQFRMIELKVVSYRNSTSNHNPGTDLFFTQRLYLIEILHQTTTMEGGENDRLELYLIEILHQTTTTIALPLRTAELYLIEILHQTTTVVRSMLYVVRCILSKFYIKPQRSTHSTSCWSCCI